MNKIITVIVTLIMTITLTACGGPTTYDEISYSELNQMIENKEDFVLFIGSETCSACAVYRITVNKVVKEYKVDIKYIDINKLSDEQTSNLQANFAFSGTPTTVFVTKGKEKDTHNRIDGNQKYSKVVSKLKENGYIKE